MNYYQPRMLMNSPDEAKNGRWDFTLSNDGHIRAVGYCAEAGKGHHANASEACECYKKYCLDKKLVLGLKNEDSMERCQAKGCGEFTQLYATIRGQLRMWTLCENHNNRETIESLFEVGEFISSY